MTKRDEGSNPSDSTKKLKRVNYFTLFLFVFISIITIIVIVELITTYICKKGDIGVHDNMFGGTLVSLIDDASASYAAQICDTPRIVTIMIDQLFFKKPVKVNNLLKIYAKVIEFGQTSVFLYIEVRKHNVYTGQQEIVTHTNIKFVRIDEDGTPIPISDKVKQRYYDRMQKYNKGLLTPEEMQFEEAK